MSGQRRDLIRSPAIPISLVALLLLLAVSGQAASSPTSDTHNASDDPGFKLGIHIAPHMAVFLGDLYKGIQNPAGGFDLEAWVPTRIGGTLVLSASITQFDEAGLYRGGRQRYALGWAIHSRMPGSLEPGSALSYLVMTIGAAHYPRKQISPPLPYYHEVDQPQSWFPSGALFAGVVVPVTSGFGIDCSVGLTGEPDPSFGICPMARLGLISFPH